ncbi:MAG: hypothetical protein IJB31_02980 [Akkermansia sp.]|nr:hypothetical protein [Akkermansia sp.]
MYITFTCPNCGGHQLQQLQQAIHRTEVKVTTSPSGKLNPAPSGVVEELRGPILGYRCRNCRYPDTRNHDTGGGFFWNTLEQIHNAGCLVITEESTEPQRCMICHKDGHMQPLIVESATPGPLSATDRSKILATRALRGAVLLCESDPGIGSFSCTSWDGVETVQI